MEDGSDGEDVQGNVMWKTSFRPRRYLKWVLLGRWTPRSSPTFRRPHSSRMLRRDGQSNIHWFQRICGNRLMFWLILIALSAYLEFYLQSKWAHDADNKKGFVGYESKKIANVSDEKQKRPLDVLKSEELILASNTSGEDVAGESEKMSKLMIVDATSARKQNKISDRGNEFSGKNRRSTTERVLHREGRAKWKGMKSEDSHFDDGIPRSNSTFGLMVGPFGKMEDRILEWSDEKSSSTCDRKGEFARRVRYKRIVLIFHELSMTGAPISMMELATEILSCGGRVSVVALSRKGGLMEELNRRGIKVLNDKTKLSYKVSIKADLVVAGSAVCASWIEQYLAHYPTGSNHLAWWIMENRREYFDRSKHVLNHVKMLLFLSEPQSNQWLAWCKEEHIELTFPPSLVPLSLNDELAFIAGFPSSLNTPSFSVEKMLDKKHLLRNAVRNEMGLTDNDVLVMSLSSINPGKGQQLLLESAFMTVQKNFAHVNKNKTRKILLPTEGEEQNLKLLIGSVGSKSNKAIYVKGILSFISQHAQLTKLVIWTPATTHVAALYAAADVYVINAQGLGETFGRVTIEAMAFGLPILGTDAGGTQEIVEHNVSGLLHPLRRPGIEVLAQNLLFLLHNPPVREQMGRSGRIRAEKYLKHHMYNKLAKVFFHCMKIK